MNSQVGPQGRAMIEHFEGCRLTAYRDGGGIWTCGYGTTGPDIHAGLCWTQEQADARFAADLERYAGYVTAMLHGAPTTAAQFGALTSFCYNAGPGSLANSPILVAHRADDYAKAHQQWLSCHIRDHNGNIEPGLVTRRAAEAKFYSTGAWQ